MQGLKVFSGNRLEILARRLSEDLSEPLTSPFAREIIVVQSKGMEHWLSMQLASSSGVCSNCYFPFPNTVMNHLFRLVLTDMPETPAFDTETMAWKVMAKLPGLLEEPGFETLKSYLDDDERGVKLYQLSTTLAGIFDSYLVFRPEMVLGWQSGELTMPEPYRTLEAWQSRLWRAVAEGREHEHLAALRESFLRQICPENVSLLPERISLFGISYLPPFSLEVFHALSRFIPVRFYLLNPCRQYWGDIRSKSEMARMSIRFRETVEELYLEEGNSLLAAFGSVGRDLFDILQDFEPQEVDAFAPIEPTTLLESLQADILDLKNPGDDERREVSGNDRSVQIHSCHSPMREVEVLRDNLLALFEADPELRPEEVLVMSPDIELYAPFIQAVFDVPAKDRDFIPFTVVDRSLKSSSTIADVVLAILEMAMSRFESSRVLELLESDPVRRRFGIAEGDIETIERWVRETGIRWGLDAAWKEAGGLPAFGENTWDFGLDRMLLGYAMTKDGGAGFARILPYDDIEGEGTQVLGSFLSFLQTLFESVRSLSQARTLGEWSSLLMGLLDDFFAVDEESVPQANALRAMFRGLSDMEAKAGLARPLSLEVIRSCLKDRIGAVVEGRNFLSGGVTFCAMLPMRSVPFKVICLLGMDHDAFPRQQRAKGFDLIGHAPRKGDCNLRNKDLYLFLEALLSARRVFYVSFLGQNMQDNSPIPPSVAVSTLLEHIDAGYCFEGGQPAGQRILTSHCLQAFNPKYFTGAGGLFSFSRENARAAEVLVQPGSQERVFIAGPLPEPGEEWRTVDVASLCKFLGNPSRFLLVRRLMMALPEGPPALEDFEPVDLTDLQLYRLKREHIERLLAGLSHEDSFELMRMDGSLPHGMPGEIVLSRIREEAGALEHAIRACIAGAEPVSRLVELPLGPFTLTGAVRTYGRDRAVLHRPAKLKATDLLTAWVHHLALCAASDSPSARTFCIARDGVTEFTPPEDPRTILLAILEAYWQGQAQPLPFFPETSWAYAKAVGKGGDRDEALRKAREAWEGTSNRQGESGDYAFSVCFQGRDPFDERFAGLALGLFGPLMKHRRGS
ncbi:MAG TPA: exodeoxyribonuclease V subunit gamma [Deltaproteobacteria bacterium]|jgi:exodeoxyribonuclease V gamma subunit|nr:exodeoxyribonuclease V subunit gamma [Deltaproteobacteria bacterium]HOI07535.1 exodeoxyribonuclease V subunit gamma [Deltaproteobacteria bacterium]